MEINLHPAEQCLNELAYCDKPWFAPERFEIIKRHMEAFAQRDQKIAAFEASVESERAANAILTEENATLQKDLERLRGRADLADDFETMLRRLVHSTRNVADSKVISIRQKAEELLRRKGSASALRQDAMGNNCEGECPACVGCKRLEEQISALSVENQGQSDQIYAYPPSSMYPDGQTWKQVAETQAVRLVHSADAERVIEWIRSGTNRAVLAFTEGPERQIAYAVEDDRLRRNRVGQ